MKKSIVLLAVMILVSTALAQEIQAPKLGAYFAFDFSKGQADSPFSRGRVGGLQAGFFLVGQFSESLVYTVETRLNSEGRVDIEQAWLAFAPSQSLRFTVGDFLVPIGKYNQASRPHETLLVQMPLVLEYAYPQSWREVGLQASAKFRFVSVALYIGNGLAEAESVALDQQFTDNNSNKAWGGRLSFLPAQTIDIGVSYYRGKYDSLDERNLTILGADATWATQDYQLLGEYIRTESANPAPFGKGVVEGFFIQMAIKYSDFYPVVSFQKVRQDDPFHGPGWSSPDQPGTGLFAKKTRWAVGLIYFPLPTVHFKAEYDFNQEEGPALKDNLFSLQVAVSF